MKLFDPFGREIPRRSRCGFVVTEEKRPAAKQLEGESSSAIGFFAPFSDFLPLEECKDGGKP